MSCPDRRRPPCPRRRLAAALLVSLVAVAAAPSRAAPRRRVRPGSDAAEGKGPVGLGELQRRLRQALTDPLAAQGKLAAYVKVQGGPVLLSRQPGLRLHPASCIKVLTGAAALRELGADHRFLTQVRGRAEGGRLATPIFLQGSGDPTLSAADLARLAAEVRKAGITEIPQGVVIDDHAFDDRRWPPGFQRSSSSGYNPPTSAVSVDGNTVEVLVTPGAPGERAQVAATPVTPHVRLDASVTTGGSTRLTMTAVPDGDALKVSVRGQVKAGAAARDWVRVLDPVRFAGEVFRAELERAGIKVGARIARGVAGETPVLARHQSRPLTEIVQVMNLNSNNFYAEQLLKAVGAKAAGAPGTTAKGLKVAGALLTRSGARAGSFRLANGSGLMGQTAVSPMHLVKLLERLHSLPWLEKAVRESLPVAGLNGTMAKRLGGTVAAGRVRAKTGTIHGVSCLTGYVEAPAGRPPILFAILHNGFTSSHGAVRKVQDRIVALLARYVQGR